MIKCRCGRWTNFGLTCAQCAAEAWIKDIPTPDEDDDEENVEPLSLDELEALQKALAEEEED